MTTIEPLVSGGSEDAGVTRLPFAERWAIGTAHHDKVAARLHRCSYEVADVRIEAPPRSPGFIAELRRIGSGNDYGGADLIAYKPREGLTAIDVKTCMPRTQLVIPGLESWTITMKAVRKMQVYCLERCGEISGYYVLGDFTCMSWSTVLGKGRVEGDYCIVNSSYGKPWEQIFGYDTGGEWPGDWPLAPAA